MTCVWTFCKGDSVRTDSFNETFTISGVLERPSFVGVCQFIVAETESNRPASAFVPRA